MWARAFICPGWVYWVSLRCGWNVVGCGWGVVAWQVLLSHGEGVIEVRLGCH